MFCTPASVRLLRRQTRTIVDTPAALHCLGSPSSSVHSDQVCLLCHILISVQFDDFLRPVLVHVMCVFLPLLSLKCSENVLLLCAYHIPNSFLSSSPQSSASETLRQVEFNLSISEKALAQERQLCEELSRKLEYKISQVATPPIYTQTQLRLPPLGLVPPIASSSESRRINLSPATAVRHADTSSHNKQAVYLSNDEVTFPVTSVGDRASLKISVCNKENATLTVCDA